jgi:hypothetical protein
MEIISVFVTLLSVLFAVWFGFKSQRLGRENVELQNRLLKLEEGERTRPAQDSIQSSVASEHYEV